MLRLKGETLRWAGKPYPDVPTGPENTTAHAIQLVRATGYTEAMNSLLVQQAYKILKEEEWTPVALGSCVWRCPTCFGRQFNGHRASCERQLVIATYERDLVDVA